MVNLTEMEELFLTSFKKDDFYEIGVSSRLWLNIFLEDTLPSNYSIKQWRGVISSLIKKGIIEVDNFYEKKTDHVIGLTEEGKKLMIEKGWD